MLDAVGDVTGKAIIDIGCGTGWLGRALGRRGARPLALDSQWALLRDAGAGSAVCAVGQSLPFADGTMDGAILFNSLHHVPGPAMADALAEAARVVRTGGWLYVAEPMATGSFFDLVRLVDDETEVRAAAQVVLADAASAGLRLRADGRYDHPAVYRSADDLLTRLVGVDPARREAVAECETTLRTGFARWGEPTPEGVRFRHPTRWHLFSI